MSENISSCFECDNCFNSDLFDGEFMCEVTKKWFDYSRIPFTENKGKVCKDFKDE